ncbi:filamentous hemagglutinin N-terminal domain-containing protein [Gluconacetobacter diazotrophicus]|uniref:Filamentous hemagglutinin N-terminal domain-containing protein n=1 Tax=Gluconacetobacter diazotrophicus TaxID=33996 RepID=A0A7W4FBN4_GLUDI|nr:MBG domain-containing protein [Gluconacetobacter diazotrophicus]MBB2154810.1 filamentous hemagglutinin N-terminal domain-containing protein [Gluconacetobacter diazotrophicus]
MNTPSRKRRLPHLVALVGFTALSPVTASKAHAGALPSGGAFVAGQGSIASAGNAMTITQRSERGVVNWQSFSIGANASVQINNGSGATLNRVTGSQMSEIQGKLGATGSVFLINPNGVVVAPGGRVVVDGSFTAATRDVSNDNFMSGGAVTASGTSKGTVTNKGTIYANDGSVTLIGQSVSNPGTIQAAHGTVAMVAGSTVVLAEDGGPEGIYVVPNAGRGSVTNAGRIQAASVELAAAHGNVYALAGNHDAVISATGTLDTPGGVYLTAGGSVTVAGTISAHNVNGSGGTILANGHDVTIASTATLDARSSTIGRAGGTILVGTSARGGKHLAQTVALASGSKLLAGNDNSVGYIETSAHHLSTGALTVNAGVGGTWLTDPNDLTIDSAAAGTISTALTAGTNVTEQTTASGVSGYGVESSGLGDINVTAPITWSGGATLTLNAYNNLNVSAPITIQGNGGLAIQTGGVDQFINPSNGGANGSVTYATPGQGSLSINSTPYSLIWTPAQLQAADSNLSGHYALAQGVDLTSCSYTPIGMSASFSGIFDGLGNTVGGLSETYATLAHTHLGLFGMASGTLANVNVAGTIVDNPGGGGMAGGLVGYTTGVVRNDNSSVNVTGDNVGGLVGSGFATNITNSSATGSVTGTAYTMQIGGLAAIGSATNSWATGSVTVPDGGTSTVEVGGLIGQASAAVSNSYATGEVNGGDATTARVGGLVGFTLQAIDDSYATGTVGATGAGAQIGGLVGYSAAVDGSYATGAVTGGDATTVGGLAGIIYGAITNSYATGAVAGGANTNGGGVTYSNSLVGGLVGTDTGGGSAISDSWSSSAVSAGAGAQVGGLIGQNVNTAPLTDVRASGKVSGGDDAYVGGLAGYTNSYTSVSVQDAVATGNVSGGDGASVGGLIGSILNGTIQNAFANGSVTGGQNALVGGLVGDNYGTISTAYATGAVTAGYNSHAGGLVGNNETSGAITDAYATGSVTDSSYGILGGLVGQSYGNESNSYATGAVSGQDSSLIGGFMGWGAGGSKANDYFDTVTTGTTVATTGTGITGITGLTTAQFAAGQAVFSDAATAWVSGAPYDVLAGLPYLAVAGAGATEVYGGGSLTQPTSVSATVVVPSGAPVAFGTGTDANAALAGIGTWTDPNSATAQVGQPDVIFASGVAAAGYQVTYQAQAAINPATLTVASGNQSSTYGQAVSLDQGAYTVTGLVNGNTVSSVNLSTAATSSSNVGSYGITASGATGTGLSNYDIAYVPGTLTITPAALTVRANDATSTYGQTPVVGGFTTSGLVNGDTVSGVTLATTATGASNVGTYGITAANAVGSGLSNYDITYQAGTLTIDPATLTITATGGSSIYGATPGAGGFTANGLVNADAVTGATLTNAATAGSGVGTYAVTASNATGTGLSNYDITYAPGVWAVDPAALTITANNATSTYGQAPTAGGFTASGLVDGDSVSSVDLASAATRTSGVGTYGITASNATGAGLSNYTIGYVPGTLTINPAALVVAANGGSSTYGQSVTPSYRATGLVNGDSVSGVSLSTSATSVSGVGSYDVTASGATGTGLGNYAITYTPGTWTIDPAALMVTASNQASTYGTTPAPGSTGFTTSGLVNGDSVTGVTLSTTATAASGVGTYGITASNAVGAGLSNYTITYQGGTWTVDPATLTVTAGNQTSVYGSGTATPTPAQVAVAPAVVASEAVGANIVQAADVATPAPSKKDLVVSSGITTTCSAVGVEAGGDMIACQTQVGR